jgi:hypothetical protein
MARAGGRTRTALFWRLFRAAEGDAGAPLLSRQKSPNTMKVAKSRHHMCNALKKVAKPAPQRINKSL